MRRANSSGRAGQMMAKDKIALRETKAGEIITANYRFRKLGS